MITLRVLRPSLILLLLHGTSWGQLTSYKAEVFSYVYEDGSAARRIILNYSRDEKDLVIAKRQFFAGQQYAVHDYPDGENYFLIAEKSWTSGDLSDEFAATRIRITDGHISFENKFLTNLVRKDVEVNGLQNDFATAKVLLADLQFSFYTILPGRITESSSGDIRQDTTVWTYDVEQILHHDYFEMSATSMVDRQDGTIWYLFFTGLAMTGISVLLFIKARVSKQAVNQKP